MSMNFLNRRDFLQGTAGLAAALAAERFTPQIAESAQQAPGGANERLNVAVIGVRGQGKSHLAGYAGRHNCHVTMICDVDSSQAPEAIKIVEKGQGTQPRYVQDLRRVMDDKSIHAGSIATPNH